MANESLYYLHSVMDFEPRGNIDTVLPPEQFTRQDRLTLLSRIENGIYRAMFINDLLDEDQTLEFFNHLPRDIRSEAPLTEGGRFAYIHNTLFQRDGSSTLNQAQFMRALKQTFPDVSFIDEREN
jgi:hypothetical protein